MPSCHLDSVNFARSCHLWTSRFGHETSLYDIRSEPSEGTDSLDHQSVGLIVIEGTGGGLNVDHGNEIEHYLRVLFF